jgi:hypothetical protein
LLTPGANRHLGWGAAVGLLRHGDPAVAGLLQQRHDDVLDENEGGAEQLDIPAEPLTLAAAPDGTAVLATTPQGAPPLHRCGFLVEDGFTAVGGDLRRLRGATGRPVTAEALPESDDGSQRFTVVLED